MAAPGSIIGQGIGNFLNQALSTAWLNIDIMKHEAFARREMRDAWVELRRLVSRLYDQQDIVEDERASQNSKAQTAGCVVAAIPGMIFGGPEGAMKACQAGGTAAGTVSDWIYDGSTWDTEAEKELQRLESEFDDWDFNLSSYATKYGIQDKLDWEQDLSFKHLDMVDDFDDWEREFYGKETGDYVMELATIGFEFAASEAGGNILGNLSSDTGAQSTTIDWDTIGQTDLPNVASADSGGLLDWEPPELLG